MTVAHRLGCFCLLCAQHHPDGCVPGYGPTTTCPEHPPTADDTVAVWLGDHAPTPSPYQRACAADAQRRNLVERVRLGITTEAALAAYDATYGVVV